METDKSRQERPDNRARLVGLLVAVLVGIVLFGIGYGIGRSRLGRTKAAYEKKLTASQARYRAAESTLTDSREVIRFLQARGWLYRSAAALDRRNFGLAGQYLENSASQIAAFSPAATGIDPAQVRAILADERKTTVVVATNVEPQREAVIRLAERLDGILAPGVGTG